MMSTPLKRWCPRCVRFYLLSQVPRLPTYVSYAEVRIDTKGSAYANNSANMSGRLIPGEES